MPDYAALEEYSYQSPEDFLELLQKAPEAKHRGFGPQWFRGEPGRFPSLLPKLLREAGSGDDIEWRVPSLIQFEYETARTLLHERHYLLPRELQTGSDEWSAELLCFLQHHGATTRLLDWTESPMAALFFASGGGSPQSEQQCDQASSVVIWELFPQLLNFLALYQNDAQSFRPLGERLIRAFVFPASWRAEEVRIVARSSGVRGVDFQSVETCYDVSGSIPHKQRPIAITSRHLSPRMAAQRGCFTLHSRDARCLCEYAKSWGRTLEKAELPIFPLLCRHTINCSPTCLRRWLRNLRVTNFQFFPDVDGFLMDMNESFQRTVASLR